MDTKVKIASPRRARSFVDGFSAGLSPSIFLWDDGSTGVHGHRRISLREIWEDVGHHIDDAAKSVIDARNDRRTE